MRWFPAVRTGDHLVYPGTITRLVRQQGPFFEVVTHGIGINRAFCTLYSPKIPVQVIVAWTNDVFGAEAFKTLDREMKKFYDSNPTGLPTVSSAPGSNKPGPKFWVILRCWWRHQRADIGLDSPHESREEIRL
jgi:hypothetical protein